ncbi:MAG TPA: Spy/CpxP family protein refolding chaperone [Blastocatellia bacterium]|nr:Spy/CpxP family protein refolding chaperone [Blastocatellia bacterium]
MSDADMRKLQTLSFFLAIALVIFSAAVSTPGQIRRPNRLPIGQRGVNRPPFGVPQAGRNPNQLRKQQLQQRVMQAIGLTPAQRMRIQEIRRSHDDDLISAGRRLRQARQALDRAIMSETYSEPEVRQATEALAAAQADKIRLDANVRSQVRGVLTPDQVQRFHQLQREMRRDMKEQQQKDQDKETGPQGLGAPKLEDIDLADLLLSVPEAHVRPPVPF